MNQKIVIAIIAIVVIVGGVFYFTRPKQTTEVASNKEATSSAETSMQSGSIKSLIEAGGSQKCTYKTTEAKYNSSGTVYVSGGKMRGDFESESDGQNQKSHMIYDGNVGYLWMDGQSTGFKMALDPKASESGNSAQSVDTNKNYEFSCEKWNVDSRAFELPSGVTFSELPTMPTGADAGAGAGAATGAGAIGGADLKSIQQQVCNSLSGTEKEQCLSAIK